MNKFKAFTLAEVLVTLVIIGIIAAITIPSLNQYTRNQEYVSGCLKAYSTLSQAINRMKVENGPIGLGAKWNNADTFWKDFAAQLNTVENCGKGTGCFVNEMFKNLKGGNEGNFNTASTGDYRLRTADGMAYSYYPGFTTDKGLSTEDGNNGIGRFFVDVNGDKGPNRIGLDGFIFVLVKGKGIVPAGTATTSDCTYSGRGYYCAAKVIREKKIDYPKR